MSPLQLHYLSYVPSSAHFSLQTAHISRYLLVERSRIYFTSTSHTTLALSTCTDIAHKEAQNLLPVTLTSVIFCTAYSNATFLFFFGTTFNKAILSVQCLGISTTYVWANLIGRRISPSASIHISVSASYLHLCQNGFFR